MTADDCENWNDDSGRDGCFAIALSIVAAAAVGATDAAGPDERMADGVGAFQHHRHPRYQYPHHCHHPIVFHRRRHLPQYLHRPHPLQCHRDSDCCGIHIVCPVCAPQQI